MFSSLLLSFTGAGSFPPAPLHPQPAAPPHRIIIAHSPPPGTVHALILRASRDWLNTTLVAGWGFSAGVGWAYH
jgi:hypothetical protein